MLSLSLIAVPTAMAVEHSPVIIAQGVQENDVVLSIDPRFTNITRISSSLTIGSLGRADCTGSTTLRYDYDCTLAMTLQQF